MKEDCYFVTGAAGFVGRHLCHHLRAKGHRVRGLVRRHDAELITLGVELIHGDLTTIGSWQEAMVGVDYIVHCAANAAFDAGPIDAAINVDSTRQLLHAALSARETLRRFVFVSSIGAVDRVPGDNCMTPLDERSPLAPSSAYGRSKASAEQLVRESGLPFSIVRPAMVVGSAMRNDSHFAVFVQMAVSRSLMARFAWTGALSVVHVDDLAAALELCAIHPEGAGKTFFCAGGPLAIKESFALGRPETVRLPVKWLVPFARACPQLFPFKLKALLLPALVASDGPLRALGWLPRQTPAAALHGVIVRERARRDPQLDPGGQTVITGAASGLGRALLDWLGPRRQSLLLIDRDRVGLEKIQQAFPHVRIAVIDLADEQAVKQLICDEIWCSPRVSEIYACAGIGFRGAVIDIPMESHAQLFKVNVLARLALTHAALPGMIRAGFGRIVFISSSSAFQALPFMASYAASNAAVLFLGEALAAELDGTGVQTLQVCPGGMQTNFHRVAGVRVIHNERLMTPQEAAKRIVQALSRRRVTVIISIRAIGMSLVARVLPRAVSVAMWKTMMKAWR